MSYKIKCVNLFLKVIVSLLLSRCRIVPTRQALCGNPLYFLLVRRYPIYFYEHSTTKNIPYFTLISVAVFVRAVSYIFLLLLLRFQFVPQNFSQTRFYFRGSQRMVGTRNGVIGQHVT